MYSRPPFHLMTLPEKQSLLDEYAGKDLNQLRTPAFIIDRAVFASNCAKMHQHARSFGATFRAHLKTHKTAEGTRLQLSSSEGKTQAVVVSTLMEAWQLVQCGVVEDGTVNDILYGLPISRNKIQDASNLRDKLEQYGAVLRLLVDHPVQVQHLEEFEITRKQGRRWSIFIKVDGGQRRAGVTPGSIEFVNLMSVIFKSAAISVHGFYGHAGDSYASTSLAEARNFLSAEVEAVNAAAGLALTSLSYDPNVHTNPFVLSVGSTPTAHAAASEHKGGTEPTMHGSVELHAGNYCLLDLQQLHTGMLDRSCIAQRVLATVISYYPGRGEDGLDEALCDAGAIAMSKDNGPTHGYGEVVGKAWRLGRISQEHGILTQISCTDEGSQSGESTAKEQFKVGELIEIIGQHACLIAAAHPWFYIVDSKVGNGRSVVDVWAPWKGW